MKVDGDGCVAVNNSNIDKTHPPRSNFKVCPRLASTIPERSNNMVIDPESLRYNQELHVLPRSFSLGIGPDSPELKKPPSPFQPLGLNIGPDNPALRRSPTTDAIADGSGKIGLRIGPTNEDLVMLNTNKVGGRKGT